MDSLDSRANRIFGEALEFNSPQQRTAFLDQACGSNKLLRETVEELLKSYQEAGSFLEEPAMRPHVESDSDMNAGKSGDGPTVAANGGQLSVLDSISRHLQTVPHVLLRDGGGDIEPIALSGASDIPPTTGRYQILGEIARGGIGVILKGRDTDLGRDLAIKVLRDKHHDQAEVIQRFIEEAQIGGQLQHPGIAPVYELGQFADSRPFFSMKLIKGQTLSSLLAERENSTDDRGRLLGIFEQVCQTMAYAHSRGVIHRDLKPSNIMVGAFGEVQVVDWGLAKVLPLGGVADEKRALDKQKDISIIQTVRSGSDVSGDFGSDTRMGSVLGTPAYMPPEQALGEIDSLDERSDVFGLGAILGEIITGSPPYVGESPAHVLRLASRGKLDECFTRLDACVADGELIELAKRCLALEPFDRPQDAGELAQSVSGYLESVESRLREAEMERAAQTARLLEERKRRRVSLALAATLVLLISVAGGAWMIVTNQQAERQRAATAEVNEALSKARLHQGLAEAGTLNSRLQQLDKAFFIAAQARDLSRQDLVAPTLRQTATDLSEDLQRSVAEIREQAEQAEADRQFEVELESIRLSHTGQWRSVWSTRMNRSETASRYDVAFRKAGLDLVELSPDEAASRIRISPARETIIAALDDWSSSLRGTPQSGLLERLVDAVAHSNWSAAAKLSREWVGTLPKSPVARLHVAPIVVLAGDDLAYREFCIQMTRDFGGSEYSHTAEEVCKTCLLRPDSIDLELLPQQSLAQALEEGVSDAWFYQWGWTTKALLAYRSGDPEAALRYIDNSQEYKPRIDAQTVNLAVRALAYAQLGESTKARLDVEQALESIRWLLKNDYAPEAPLPHDALIALILGS